MTTSTPDDAVYPSDATVLLFELGPDEPRPPAPRPGGTPRFRRAQRDQIVLRPLTLDALLPEPHQARVVWDFVQGLDLTPLYQRIAAVQGRPGRTPGDPRIL